MDHHFNPSFLFLEAHPSRLSLVVDVERSDSAAWSWLCLSDTDFSELILIFPDVVTECREEPFCMFRGHDNP